MASPPFSLIPPSHPRSPFCHTLTHRIISAGLVGYLEAEFGTLQRSKDATVRTLEPRVRNMRYVAELSKFRLFPHGAAFSMLKGLLDEFSGHNIDAACAMVETAGRFFYRWVHGWRSAVGGCGGDQGRGHPGGGILALVGMRCIIPQAPACLPALNCWHLPPAAPPTAPCTGCPRPAPAWQTS